MRLHLKRLATGAIILAILLGALWVGVNNEQLLNTILFVASFCIISYMIGYFLLKIRLSSSRGNLNVMKKKYFFWAFKNRKVESNDSRRASYRKQNKSPKNRKDNLKI